MDNTQRSERDPYPLYVKNHVNLREGPLSKGVKLTTTCASRICEDGGIHSQNVGQSQESGQARAHLCRESRASLLQLEIAAHLRKEIEEEFWGRHPW